MNDLEFRGAIDTIQQEIDIVVLDQGNHMELSYVLRGISADKIRALLAHITELKSSGEQITYELLASAIGEEESV